MGHSVKHGKMVFEWDSKKVFLDPVCGAAPFKKFGTPDLLLVTDIHRDHFNKDTLTAVVKEKTVVIAPEAVAARSGIVKKAHLPIGHRQIYREGWRQSRSGADVQSDSE